MSNHLTKPKQPIKNTPTRTWKAQRKDVMTKGKKRYINNKDPMLGPREEEKITIKFDHASNNNETKLYVRRRFQNWTYAMPTSKDHQEITNF